MNYFIFPTFVEDEENKQIQRECFDSFIKTTNFVNKQIIVIDNGSIYEAYTDARGFATHMISFAKPIGFAKAVNLGWKLTEAIGDAEYIGVLNNDLVFHEGWFDGLLDHIDDNTAAVAPSDYPLEGVNDHIWSSCFFQRADIRRRIGFFDEKLNYRYHDQDYWIRAKKLGLNFKRIGKNRVDHKESTTYKKMLRSNPAIADIEQNEANIMLERYGVKMAQDYINKLST